MIEHSPGTKSDNEAEPGSVEPDELQKIKLLSPVLGYSNAWKLLKMYSWNIYHSVLIAFLLCSLKSHILIKAPDAENRILDIESYSNATTGPRCEDKQWEDNPDCRFQTLTVRSERIYFQSLNY